MKSQEFLNRIAGKDEFGFLQGITGNWENHRPLLYLSLHLNNEMVIELGCGEGSTSYLRKFCNKADRRFLSYDSDRKWADKCGADWVPDWDEDFPLYHCGIAFIDHAPGEHRIVAIEKFAPYAGIIVIHDTEEGGAGDYKFDTMWHLFKYRLNYNRLGGGAGATAVSNTIDLNRFRGLSLGPYTFDND